MPGRYMFNTRCSPTVDWTYSEGCGCKATFHGATLHRTSHMTACPQHNKRDQMRVRDDFIERARATRRACVEPDPQ